MRSRWTYSPYIASGQVEWYTSTIPFALPPALALWPTDRYILQQRSRGLQSSRSPGEEERVAGRVCTNLRQNIENQRSVSFAVRGHPHCSLPIGRICVQCLRKESRRATSTQRPPRRNHGPLQSSTRLVQGPSSQSWTWSARDVKYLGRDPGNTTFSRQSCSSTTNSD